jgi:hypothetical protein
MDELSEPDAREADSLRERLAEDASEPSLADDLRLLIDDGRAYLKAEIGWQKARLLFAGSQAGVVILFGLLAAALIFGAMMALVFGLVLALAPMLTIWGAMAAVIGGFLIAAGLAALLAMLRLRRMIRLLADRTAES